MENTKRRSVDAILGLYANSVFSLWTRSPVSGKERLKNNAIVQSGMPEKKDGLIAFHSSIQYTYAMQKWQRPKV